MGILEIKRFISLFKILLTIFKNTAGKAKPFKILRKLLKTK